MYNNDEESYLLIETENETDFKIGDTVYIENHTIDPFYKKDNIYKNTIIESVYPLKDWLYSLETEYINKDGNGTTSAGVMQGYIEKIKQWFYNNISSWTKNDSPGGPKIIFSVKN